MTDFKGLQLAHVRTRLRSLKENDMVPRPNTGWIRFIREALGMSSRALAQRLGISAPSMTETEKAELEETITLRKLRRVADELNCDLVYYLLPREDIGSMIEKRARHVAEQRVRDVAQSMELEDQAVSAEFVRTQTELETQRLLTSKKLWDE